MHTFSLVNRNSAFLRLLHVLGTHNLAMFVLFFFHKYSSTVFVCIQKQRMYQFNAWTKTIYICLRFPFKRNDFTYIRHVNTRTHLMWFLRNASHAFSINWKNFKWIFYRNTLEHHVKTDLLCAETFFFKNSKRKKWKLESKHWEIELLRLSRN